MRQFKTMLVHETVYIKWTRLTSTLQKQVGCFNHRVVTLVADKLERQRLLEVCFDVED